MYFHLRVEKKRDGTKMTDVQIQNDRLYRQK